MNNCICMFNKNLFEDIGIFISTKFFSVKKFVPGHMAINTPDDPKVLKFSEHKFSDPTLVVNSVVQPQSLHL